MLKGKKREKELKDGKERERRIGERERERYQRPGEKLTT